MRVLTTKEAINLVDSGKEIPFEYIEKYVSIQLKGDNEILESESLISFINNFIQYGTSFTTNDDELYNINHSIAYRTLSGYSLNIVLSECSGVVIND